MNTPNFSLLPTLKVTIEEGIKPIKLKEVMYIEGNGKHSLIHFIDLTTLETNHLLKWYEERLPVPEFCRCHDSYIVNLFFVECISGSSFLMQKFPMQKALYIPISEKKKEATNERYEEFIRKNNFH